MWGLCKTSFWALPLLLLIPASTFKSRPARLAYVAAVCLCVVAALLIWNGIASGNVEAFRAARLTRGIDITANVRHVAAHPLAFSWQLLNWFRTHYKSELAQFLGGFGWTRFALPLWVRTLCLLLLVVVAATESSAKRFLVWERAVLFLVFLTGAVFVHAAIFVSDGTLCPGSLDRLCFNATAGVQGRYFLPFCLAGLLTLRQDRVNLPPATLFSLVTVAGTLHALAALALIRSTYYF